MKICSKDGLVKALHYNASLEEMPKQFTESATENLGDDSYYFNENFNALKVNDSNTNKKGSLTIPVGYIQVGDVIRVKCELYSISGVQPKIALDICSEPDLKKVNAITSNNEIIKPDCVDGFKHIDVKIVNRKNGYGKLVIGTFLVDIGEYYVRNVEVIGEFEKQYSYRKTSRTYNFKKTTLQKDYTDDDCTVVVDDTGKSIQITHKKPFSVEKFKGVCFVANNSSGGNNPDIEVRAKGESYEGVTIMFYDRVNKTYVSPNSLGDYFWWGVHHIGYDYY